MNNEYYQKLQIWLLKSIKLWKNTKIRCKLHKFFAIKSFSKGDILVLSLIFVYGAILYTPWYRFLFFIIATDIGWISGRMGYKKMREKLEKAEQIIENPNVPISKKYTVAVEAVHESCDTLGRVMDRYNLKQGTAPYVRDLQNIEDNKKKQEVKE